MYVCVYIYIYMLPPQLVAPSISRRLGRRPQRLHPKLVAVITSMIIVVIIIIIICLCLCLLLPLLYNHYHYRNCCRSSEARVCWEGSKRANLSKYVCFAIIADIRGAPGGFEGPAIKAKLRNEV